MTEGMFRQVMTYQTTMALMRRALNEGAMNEDEFIHLEEKFARKYGLESSVIYRIKPLINNESRANMGVQKEDAKSEKSGRKSRI